MKFICNQCKGESACMITFDGPEDCEHPYACPFAFIEEESNANWKQVNETENKEEKRMKELSIGAEACQTAKPGQVEQDYREDSVVATNKDRIEKLAKAHWSYVEKVIKSGADTARTFTFEEVMVIRKWDYTSAAIHFYGHGYEDGQGVMAKKTLNRLKEV